MAAHRAEIEDLFAKAGRTFLPQMPPENSWVWSSVPDLLDQFPGLSNGADMTTEMPRLAL